MAIETVQYKKCTCDVCGVEEVIPTSLGAPKTWWKLHFAQNGLTLTTLDLCDACHTEISDHVENMMNRGHTSC